MGGTPREEIERQHAEAVRLVESRLPCMEATDRGEIPLSRKGRPTSSVPSVCACDGRGAAADGETAKNGGGRRVGEDPAPAAAVDGSANGDGGSVGAEDWCVSFRGVADVGPLADLVSEGYDDPAPERGGGDDDDGASAASASTDATGAANRTNGGANRTNGGGAETKKKAKKKKKTPSLYERLRSRPVPSPTNLWDEANAAQSNVHVTRPSHDAWGIKKIIFVFCDDFLRDVYEMPWWHSSPSMRDAVRPILDVLGVPPIRVVRMLLAALPPGVTIPVHHDTGEWVRLTHRVHVPVVVDEPRRVLFRCGPSEDDMGRVDCSPGRVFELNNAAKHSVSNCSDRHRVHLILDYVDGDFDGVRRRVRLRPGERLLQTRRSIDRAADAGSRPCPSYLILGAQKAGTTSLYDYLNQHPLVVKPRRRETHNLDWRWDGSLRTAEERREHCLKFFYSRELRSHPSCLTGESTPSYLLDSRRVIPRLREVYPHEVKFIVMCRDPVKRAHSHYAMVTSLDGNPEQIKARGTQWLNMTFEEVVRLDLDNMREDGLLPYWDAEAQTVDMDLFHSFAGSREEDEAWDRYLSRRVPLGTGSHSLISRGMYELQLRPWLRSFPRERFLVLRLEDMSSASSERRGGVQRAVDRALRHLDLPPYKVRDESAKNARSYEPMGTETRDMLRRFYEPHNRRLRGLLKEEEWEDPWPYD